MGAFDDAPGVAGQVADLLGRYRGQIRELRAALELSELLVAQRDDEIAAMQRELEALRPKEHASLAGGVVAPPGFRRGRLT